MLKIKSNLRNVAAIAACLAVTVMAGCGKDDNKPPAAILETISITEPVARAADRTITDQAGEFAYTDKANVTVKMTFANAEPKDSAIVINLTSRVTWNTTPKKFNVSGDLTTNPKLSGTDKITVRYGNLEVTDLFTVTNTPFTIKRSGKSAEMPFFGFSNVEAVGNATYKVTWSNSSGTTIEEHSLTQKFRITHSDGTSKEVEFVVLENEKR